MGIPVNLYESKKKKAKIRYQYNQVESSLTRKRFRLNVHKGREEERNMMVYEISKLYMDH